MRSQFLMQAGRENQEWVGKKFFLSEAYNSQSSLNQA